MRLTDEEYADLVASGDWGRLLKYSVSLRANVAHWEHKEITRASCCYAAEKLIQKLADNGVEAAQDFLVKNAEEWK